MPNNAYQDMTSNWTRNWQKSIAVKITTTVLWVFLSAAFVVAGFKYSAGVKDEIQLELNHQADRLSYVVYRALSKEYVNEPEVIAALQEQMKGSYFSEIKIRFRGKAISVGSSDNTDEIISRTMTVVGRETDNVVVDFYSPELSSMITAVRMDALITLFAFTIPFAGFLIWIIRYSVHAPLKQLLVATKAIGEGKRNVVLDVTGEDEFGELSRFFMEMLDKLVEQQMDLESAVEEAQKASKSKSAFLANMSHEIRTPLTAIIGFSDALLENKLNAKDREDAIKTIVRSGRHLLGVINDILDLSKIEADKIDLELVDVDLVQALTEVDSLVRITAESKGLNFDIRYEFPLPRTIYTDPTRLRQILINLISNAIKFTERGKVEATASYDAELCVLKVVVKDSGIGMTEEQCGKLFQAFTQADISTTRKFGGTGLGLVISRRFAEMLGGNIFVKSKPGEGSEFTLIVSTGIESKDDLVKNADELEDIQEHAHKHASENIQLSGKILLAEDNDDNYRLINVLAIRVGLQLDRVANGRFAVERATSQHYDLILMDIQMPEMDGVQATLTIRKTDEKTPIVAITANVMRDDLDLYEKSGFNNHIQKPIDPHHFYDVLAEYLPRANKPVASVTSNQSDSPVVLQGKVLLAEDTLSIQKLVKMRIEDTGASVHVVGDGQAAVEAALSNDFDLIFMDHNMPEMTGHEAVVLLVSAGITCPIYMMTGEVDQKFVERCKAEGAAGCLQKPVEFDKLRAVLRQHLRVVSQDKPTGAKSKNTNPMLEDPMFKAVVTEFITGLPGMMQGMQVALADQNWPVLQDLLHQLKGSGASFGYPAITDEAAIYEKMVKQKDYGGVKLDKFQDIVDKVVQDFAAMSE